MSADAKQVTDAEVAERAEADRDSADAALDCERGLLTRVTAERDALLLIRTERCAKLDEELAAECLRTDALVAAVSLAAGCCNAIGPHPSIETARQIILAARKERP